jgi:hypothetical protein
MQNGLLASQCQAFVFAYDNRSAYLANRNDGYTAGRVALTNNSGSERNLEVDTGNFYHPQTQFNFNYYPDSTGRRIRESGDGHRGQFPSMSPAALRTLDFVAFALAGSAAVEVRDGGGATTRSHSG